VKRFRRGTDICKPDILNYPTLEIDRIEFDDQIRAMCSPKAEPSRIPQTRIRRDDNVNNTLAPPTPIIILRLISTVPAIDEET